MNDPTPEQSAADEALRAAIIAHAEAYDIARPGEMLSEYAIVGAWEPMDGSSTRDGTYYTSQYDRPSKPTHAAVGLYYCGIEMVFEPDDD